MRTQKALKNSCVEQLKRSIGENLPRYCEGKSWIAEYFARTPGWEFFTPLELESRLELALPTEKDLHDLENAIRLHKAFPTLTPLQARDPRLWTHLTHVGLWSYMIKRWPVAKHKDKPETARNVTLSRYFVARNESRALLRNGIARLWWSARLTFVPERTNPYELTGVLFNRLDIAQQLLERNLGRNPTIRTTFLEYLSSNPEDCLQPGNRSRMVVRHLAQSLNFHGGVCLLDSMKPDELFSFLDQEREVAVAAYDQMPEE